MRRRSIASPCPLLPTLKDSYRNQFLQTTMPAACESFFFFQTPGDGLSGDQECSQVAFLLAIATIPLGDGLGG